MNQMMQRMMMFGNLLPNPADIVIPISWTNYLAEGFPYETFIAEGDNLLSVINTGGYGAARGTVTLIQGNTYKININLTLNSGTAPQAALGSLTNASIGDFPLTTLVSGENIFVITVTGIAENNCCLWLYNNLTTTNFSATVSLVEPRGL